MKNILIIIAVYLLLVCFFFQSETFFYWDEWHVLGRFREMGISGVIYTHNEHFLPLFFLIYFLQAALFGTNYDLYLLSNLALHLLNGWLIFILLREIAEDRTKTRQAAAVVSLIYLFNACHVEVLHWAFTLAVVSGVTAILLALYFTVRFLKDGSRLYLVYSLVSAFFAPLLFGNGFMTAVWLGFLCLMYIFYYNDNRQAIFRRSASLLIGVGVVIGIVAYLYTTSQESGGHGVGEIKVVSDKSAIIDYIIVGAEMGTVLRGMGLYPILELGAADEVVKFSQEPELFLSNIGMVVSLVVLLLTLYWSSNRRQSGLIFVTGQLFILSTFVLPAIGRWQHGVTQSLALRYQYMAQIGLVFMLFALIYAFLEHRRELKKISFIWLLCVYYFISQFILSYNFDYFVNNGVQNRIFEKELLAWNEKLCEAGGSMAKSYEGVGTKFESKQPVMPPGLTPGRHPNDIYQTLIWLNGEGLSLDCR